MIAIAIATMLCVIMNIERDCVERKKIAGRFNKLIIMPNWQALSITVEYFLSRKNERQNKNPVVIMTEALKCATLLSNASLSGQNNWNTYPSMVIMYAPYEPMKNTYIK